MSTRENLSDIVARVVIKSGDDLRYAAKHGNIDDLTAILDNNPTILDEQRVGSSSVLVSAGGNGRTALMAAAGEGHVPIVELLLNRGCDVNLKDRGGWTALTWAANRGRVNVCELLLKKNCKVDLQDEEGQTALEKAAYFGYAAIVELLLNYKCNINKQDEDGESALTLAAYRGNTPVVELLISHPKCKIDIQNKVGATALARAANHGHIDIVVLLLDRYCSVNVPDKYNMTPLMCAATSGYVDISRLLLLKGADTDVISTGSYGERDALEWARQKGHTDIVTLIERENRWRRRVHFMMFSTMFKNSLLAADTSASPPIDLSVIDTALAMEEITRLIAKML